VIIQLYPHDQIKDLLCIKIPHGQNDFVNRLRCYIPGIAANFLHEQGGEKSRQIFKILKKKFKGGDIHGGLKGEEMVDF